MLNRVIHAIERKKDNVLDRLRSFWIRHLVPDTPRDLHVIGSVTIAMPENVRIGSGVVLNHGVYINARKSVRIGNRVHLSAGAMVITASLDIRNPERPHISESIDIQDDVWIAAGVIILPGVSIGKGAVIGAGAVVTHDMPPYFLCVGVPAQPIRELPHGS